MRAYRFHREARAEYFAALDWYGGRSEAAGDGFAALVAGALRDIRELPAAWPVWRTRSEIRVRVLRDYPYSVPFMLAAGDEIVILAIAHQKRRPGYWLPRADE